MGAAETNVSPTGNRSLTCTLVAAAVLVVPPGANAAEPLSVNVDRATIATRLGHKFSFRTTITNAGPTAASGYVAHLNVLSYDRDVWRDLHVTALPLGFFLIVLNLYQYADGVMLGYFRTDAWRKRY